MKNNTIEFLVNNEDAEKRLDICLSNHISHLTRSSLKKAIEKRKSGNKWRNSEFAF